MVIASTPGMAMLALIGAVASRLRFTQVGAPAPDFADPVVGLAPVLQRLVAPALILFEYGDDSPLRRVGFDGLGYGHPHHQCARQTQRRCARQQRRTTEENVQHDEPRKPRGEFAAIGIDRLQSKSARRAVSRRGIQARKSRGGRSGPSGMKPLNAAAGEGVKRCRSGMITTLSVTGTGSADASAHAAQCLQSC